LAQGENGYHFRTPYVVVRLSTPRQKNVDLKMKMVIIFIIWIS